MRTSQLLMTAFVLGSPVQLSTQPVSDTVIMRLRPGQTLRLHLDDGRSLEGHLLAVNQAPLALQLSGTAASVPAASIDSLWVRGRTSATGALIGAIALGVPTSAFLAALCERVEGGCPRGVAVGGALAGVGVGALLGAAQGTVIKKWRLRYPHAGLTLDPTRDALGIMVQIPF